MKKLPEYFTYLNCNSKYKEKKIGSLSLGLFKIKTPKVT